MTIYALGDKRIRFASSEYFVAPSASVIGDVRLGHQASIWFNCVVRADAESVTIGDRVNVQDGSVLHCDPGKPLILEADVSIGHKVMLHGCTIGEGSLVGMNAVILNGAHIGKHSLVGAHTLVPEGKRFPDGVLLMGTPAKIVRELTPEDQLRVARTAANYVARSAQYRQLLKLIPDDIL